MPEHRAQHVPDDEAGRAHVDPVQRVAADRLVRVHVLRDGAQRGRPETTAGTEEGADARRCSCSRRRRRQTVTSLFVLTPQPPLIAPSTAYIPRSTEPNPTERDRDRTPYMISSCSTLPPNTPPNRTVPVTDDRDDAIGGNTRDNH